MGAYVEKRMADTTEKYLRESRRTFPPIPPPLPHTNYFSVADKMGSTYNKGLPNIPTEFTQHAWPVTRKFKKEPLSCWRSSSMSRPRCAWPPRSPNWRWKAPGWCRAVVVFVPQAYRC